MTFFTDSDYYTGPALTADALVNAERVLGVRLPTAYAELLRERNGGCPRRACLAFSGAKGWAPDHIRVQAILGVGGRWGIEDNASMITEWGYPPIGVVICLTPSGGHDTIMLDYRGCGPQGEPAVVYIDDDRAVLNVAESFSQFLDKLVNCSVFSPP